MATYLIRTSKQEKKIHILMINGDSKEKLGLIYTDFNLSIRDRDLSNEDIIDTNTKKAIGKIKLFEKDQIISVFYAKKEISSWSYNEEYKENNKNIPYKKLQRQLLLAKPEYKSLKEMGISHAYFLDEKSSLSQVFCFERGGELSGLVYDKSQDNKANLESALKGLTLVLAQRILEQDYLFEFMKK